MTPLRRRRHAAGDGCIYGFVLSARLIVAASIFASQFQKLAHKNNVEKKPYTSLPLWWLGLSLMLGGEVGNFLAYGWAPATVCLIHVACAPLP